MRNLVLRLLLLLASTMLFAQSSFDGTWRLNLDSVQLPQRPDSYLLASGRFKCLSCVKPRPMSRPMGRTTRWRAPITPTPPMSR